MASRSKAAYSERKRPKSTFILTVNRPYLSIIQGKENRLSHRPISSAKGTGGLNFLIADALLILCHSLFEVVIEEAIRGRKEAADKEAELREEQKRLLETAKERLQEYQEEAIRTRDAIESAKSSIEKYDRSIASSNERIKKATDQIYEWRQQLGDANFNAESSKIGHTTK